MFAGYALGAFLTSAGVLAQMDETGPNNDTTPQSIENEIVVHEVTAGHVPHAFQPNSINVNPGDKVMFKLYSGNHTVIQSLYGWPCVPRGAVDGVRAFYSGLHPNASDANPAAWNLTVRSTDTIFYYCGAPGSCVNYGMVGVINPTNETDLTGQIALAKAARYVLQPFDTLPAASAASISSLAATILASPSNTTSATPNDSNSHNDSSSLSAGAIEGIVIGSLAALVLLSTLIFYLGHHTTRKHNQNHHQQPDPTTQFFSPTTPRAPEMTVDGITYVPAYDARPFSSSTTAATTPPTAFPKPNFLPPYHHDPLTTPTHQDPRAQSPETTVQKSFSPHASAPHPLPFSGSELEAHGRFEPEGVGLRRTATAAATRHELSAVSVRRQGEVARMGQEEEEERRSGLGSGVGRERGLMGGGEVVESPTLGPRFISP